MFAPALRRYIGNRTFNDFQQRLLHTLARNVARNRRTVGLAGNLVYFININDAALRLFNIIIRRLHQFQNNVFNIFADITGCGQSRRVRNRKRHVQNLGQRLRQQRFARTCRTDENHVRLRNFNILGSFLTVQPFVMVIHRHRQHLFGLILTDNVLIQKFLYF